MFGFRGHGRFGLFVGLILLLEGRLRSYWSGSLAFLTTEDGEEGGMVRLLRLKAIRSHRATRRRSLKGNVYSYGNEFRSTSSGQMQI